MTGRILVRGGNLTAREGTAVPVVQVANPNGSTRIASDGSTEVKTLAVESPVVLSGKAGTVDPYKDSDKTDSIRAIWQQDTFSKNMKVATMNLLIRQLPV